VKIDTTKEFGARVSRRLAGDQVAWLVTVGEDGTPQPSPIWFLWDGQACLVYSHPDTPKIRNITRRPRAALHFDGDGRGGDIVVLTGEARVVADHPPADQVPAYLEKYRQGLLRIGMTAERFALTYSASILFTPTQLRGH
jgi:PPOX class probable F420-dependent enzyme